MPTITVKARGLRNADVLGKSDPYCLLKCGTQTNRTKVVLDNLDPEWNEQFVFSNISTSTNLVVDVFDKDDIGSDDFLGQLDIPLVNIQTSYNDTEQWWTLHGIDDGKVKHSAQHVTGEVLLHIKVE